MTLSFQKTRLAPTPSGYLHIGNVVSFLITCSLARHHGAKVLLRIDDLDQKRTRTKYIQDIFDTMEFLEIPYDEGPRSVKDLLHEFSQGHRMDLYEGMLEYLREKDLVFGCDCSRKKLRENHPKGWYTGTCLQRHLHLDSKDISWRLNALHQEQQQIKTFPDTVRTCILPRSMNYFVVRKKDGDPAYQLTSLADDIYFGVDLIVRGEDLWSSSCAQIQLSGYLPEDPLSQVTFFHHPLVKEGKQKLSKSDGAMAITTMREKGMSKADIYQLAGRHLGLNGPVNTLSEFEAAYMENLKRNPLNHHNPE
ncbi:glutamate--tRNA ligase family protein [Cyclobacterium plantarum]|uniref:tRNA glutamyl-Q synthetase n=1 Tax=Cyclobacterium plantarum TaxID=2716263 RepID=A0ABX0H1H2_9BACT|nr:glutamate--tRNA ligase family protein [Cyclobacterium plantarum]NHE55641.1 tRNA glutamyl-Q synthetase [Cyclobacterium plantarum]